MFNSLFELASNVTKVVGAPIEMAAELANAALEPFVEAAEDLVEDIKSIKD